MSRLNVILLRSKILHFLLFEAFFGEFLQIKANFQKKNKI